MTIGRPPKTLAQHVRDGTFRATRHAALLDDDLLAPTAPTSLRDLQLDYQKCVWPRIRAAIAVQFAELAQRGCERQRVLTRQQILLAQRGPLPTALSARDAVRLAMRWELWDRLHGARWRRNHDIPLTRDLKPHPLLADIGPPPDPPGWHLLPPPQPAEGFEDFTDQRG